MDTLQKLEQTQSMISFLHSHNLSTNHDASDRFLADFLLFLVQPCGVLNLEWRCSLISEQLPKISAAILHKGLSWITGQDYKEKCAEIPTRHCLDKSRDLPSLSTIEEEMPVVGLNAMQRANSTLEDFCRSYFMFHEMDVSKPQSVFRFLPVLSFTESFIYKLDSFNEEILRLSMKKFSDSEAGSEYRFEYKAEGNKKATDRFLKAFDAGPFKPLVHLLEHHGLLTERISAEFRFGSEYWALERKLCLAVMGKTEISVEDVMRAINLKSFDYRVLNLLLYRLRDQEVNECHMEFLSISEFLVEISDDLFDYEVDVLENNFNILRMFVALYGASMAPRILAKCITEAEEKYESLSKKLDPKLSSNYRKRCEEATREGGKTMGHVLGTWSIPPVIADEESYRSHSSRSNSLVIPD